jgi:hypothetical protein
MGFRTDGPAFSAAQDAVLRRMRADGQRWQDIAAALGRSPDVVRERGRRIGAPAPGHVARAPAEDPYRPPLPPGHPRTWGLLTEGTGAAGTAWPGWDVAERWE